MVFSRPTVFSIAFTALSSITAVESREVPNKYLVSLRSGIDSASIGRHIEWVRTTQDNSRRRGGDPVAGFEHRYDIGGFHAYSGEFDEATIAEIEANDDVYLVEPDVEGGVMATITQTNAPYGLEAISSRSAPNVGTNTLGGTYRYDSTAGEGSFVYVMDTGVQIDHPEFEGRAIKGFNGWADIEDDNDNGGHGTHVAGTAAGKTYGVAKKATIVDVKTVYSQGFGTASKYIECLEWIVNNVTQTPGRLGRSVINTSLGFPGTSAIDAAVQAAFDAGILNVVAAGNSNAPIDFSPARAAAALTVGALSFNNTRAVFSSYGPELDIWAVGDQVVSSVPGNKVDTYSGTSMASPTVAGLVAYLRTLGGDSLSDPAALTRRVLELATEDVVVDAIGGSVNLAAFNGIE